MSDTAASAVATSASSVAESQKAKSVPDSRSDVTRGPAGARTTTGANKPATASSDGTATSVRSLAAANSTNTANRSGDMSCDLKPAAASNSVTSEITKTAVGGATQPGGGVARSRGGGTRPATAEDGRRAVSSKSASAENMSAPCDVTFTPADSRSSAAVIRRAADVCSRNLGAAAAPAADAAADANAKGSNPSNKNSAVLGKNIVEQNKSADVTVSMTSPPATPGGGASSEGAWSRGGRGAVGGESEGGAAGSRGVGSRGMDKMTVEIRTKSVEQTLVPLVTQITTLVNARERLVRSERTLGALRAVGTAVTGAVDRFVAVGVAIATEHPEIQRDMGDACDEARQAGLRIQRVTDVRMEDSGIACSGADHTNSLEKASMVRAARQLLSAITRVLLLADKVVVKQLILAKNKVLHTLGCIEGCTTFAEFVNVFSQFGNEMVELAHLSGDRQQDLKSEKCRAQISAARAVLEKSTMALLTTAKTSLRHPECASARDNTLAVLAHMRRALDALHNVVSLGGYTSGNVSPSGGAGGGSPSGGAGGGANCDSGINLSQHQPTAVRALKDFNNQVEMTRVTLIGSQTECKLLSLVESLIDATQDFTDSAYTSHDRRQRILMACERLRHELTVLLRVGVNAREGRVSSALSHQLETEILKTQEASKYLHNQLVETALEQASEVFRLSEDQALLADLRAAALGGLRCRVDELSVKFDEHSDQLQEVCKLLRHIAATDPVVVWAEHLEHCIRFRCPEVVRACQTLATHPTSKMALENSEVFVSAWQTQINDLSALVKDVNDVCNGKGSGRQVYLSLPRPGKHGSNARAMKPSQLSSEEQAKIAKAGLEMKLLTSEMDAEADRWSSAATVAAGDEGEIVRRAKNMSSMAFSMYLFTRGEGALRTTQDLFTQAGYFAQEGTKLFKAVKLLSLQLPPEGWVGERSELVAHTDILPYYCQQLIFTVKAETVGKAATFNKVDKVIQETKNLMNAVSKVITTSFLHSAALDHSPAI